MQHIPSAIVYLGIIPVVFGIGNIVFEKDCCSALFTSVAAPRRFGAGPARVIAARRLTWAEVDFGIATPS
jgi:hypothetical protein